MRERPRPFISYAREDQRHAIRLYGELCAMGAEPWFDAVALLPGQDWEQAIRAALASCSHVIALISRRSIDKRGFVQKELRTALELLREFPPGEIFLIPVRLEDVEPQHEELRRIQWADLFADRSVALKKIARSLQLDLVSLTSPAVRAIGGTASAKRLWSRQRLHAATRWFGVGVNDFLPEYQRIEAALRSAGVEHWYRFSDHASNPPPQLPKYRVIAVAPHIGMTPLRGICEAVAKTGDWYVQLWPDGIREHTIVVGAYGYGGRRAARFDETLLRQLRRPAFTRTKLQRWIDEQGVVLDADYPRSDD